MDAARHATGTPESTQDLSALAWVQEELRKSLDTAHKALRRFLKESEAVGGSDVDSVDPSVLRTARAQIHQGVGALELVGLPAAATLLRASEATVQRYVAKPHKINVLVVEAIEHASFALLDYLARLLAGKQVSALSLFPQYRAVQEAAGAERVHPADLWATDWRWREIPADPNAAPLGLGEQAQAAMEGLLLSMMRAPVPQTVAQMSELCAGLGAGAGRGQAATLWKLASAVFEAQAHGLLGNDVFSKRVSSRLLAQYKALAKPDGEVSERLAQDLLFFCAQSASPGDGRATPRLAAVRQAYGLAHHVPVDYAVSVLGRFDPAWIAQARKRVTAAKESWSGVAGGELHRLSGLSEQFTLVADSLKRLFPHGEVFGTELQQAIAQTQASGAMPPPPLAMEVATSLLYIEAALEDSDFDNPEQADRVKRLAERLAAVRQGRAPDPLEPWMEELYRRVSDRQTMGSVVQELRATLSEVEKQIDQYFRNPADRAVLIPVPSQMASMRGVLSVLGIDHGAASLVRMRDEVDQLAATEVDTARVAQTGAFDRLASNLGALGFLIDMLSVQPTLAKSLFAYDAEAGLLKPLMGLSAHRPPEPEPALPIALVEPRLIEQAQQLAVDAASGDVPVETVARDLERLSLEAEAAHQPGLSATVEQAQRALGDAQGADDLAEARAQISEALVDFVNTATGPMGLDPLPVAANARPTAPAPLPPLSPPAPPAEGAGTELAEDDEMREVFLEEAREVVQDATGTCRELGRTPSEMPLQASVRRAFHTLKGSARMVGLKEFGEAAWACEQLYNSHLASQRDASSTLLDFTEWVLGYLGAWVEDIAARRVGPHTAAEVRAAAEEVGGLAQSSAPAPLESQQAREPFLTPLEPSAPPASVPPDVSVPAVVEQPLAAMVPDLPSAADLDLAAPASAPEPIAEPAFELDLSAFEDPVPTALPTLDLDVGALQKPFDLPEAAKTVRTEFDVDTFELDLDISEPMPLASAVPDLALEIEAPAAAASPADELPPLPSEDENVKIVGPLRIGIPLFNIYLNEADELSRRLTTEVAEWAMELHRPVAESSIALAHSLAGSSATVGFTDLSHLARSLEHAQMRSQSIGHGTPEEAKLFVDASEEIRRLLHQFAAGFLREPDPVLLDRLAQHEVSSARRLEAATAADELLDATAEAPAAAAAPVVPIEQLLRLDLMPAREPEPEPEPTPVAEAAPVIEPVPEPEPEAVMSAVPAAEPQPEIAELQIPQPEVAEFSGSGFTPTNFGTLDTRFDPLGLAELKPLEALPEAPVRRAEEREARSEDEEDIDAVDAVDAELFPIFEEEGQELLPKLASQLRDWVRRPDDVAHASGCMRTLHTLKGGARLAGAMRLGEMAHRLETRIEHALAHQPVDVMVLESLQGYSDALAHAFETLRHRDAKAYAEAEKAAASASTAPVLPVIVAVVPPVVDVTAALPDEPVDEPAAEPTAERELQAQPEPSAVPRPVIAARPDLPPIDWSRFIGRSEINKALVERVQAAPQSAVRVRAPLLDRLVNHAGEVSITRSRIETGIGQIKGSLADLSENLDRLRQQLRDIELQAETQMSSRLEAAKAASQSFDPLEFDRFTRFQELTRMMAESVNDVATVQRTLQRSLDTTEDELVAQARLTRDLQDDLLRTRMVEFEGLSDRLYRVVRQAAKETGKQVRLDIVGGSIEVDRGVLDRMTGAFEHLLRNCVGHGIEAPALRSAAGKDPAGNIIVSLTHEGNEVGVEFRDDGAGLDLARIRAKAQAMGLIDANVPASDAELANLIFTPGFSTAETVTELAGRGVGMDVVRSEVNAMGGRVETATAAGQGTSFKLILPLTTAVTQVVMVRCGDATVAIPSTLVEIVRRATPAEVEQSYNSGSYVFGDRSVQFFWLGALLQLGDRPTESTARTRSVIVVRSAQQRIAIHVDEVLGNQEVVVKNLGPQLSRMPGLAGMTLLASGMVALIYNPVALATLYGEAARRATLAALQAPVPVAPHKPAGGAAIGAETGPLVLVVDDSLTVRRVTQRLLVREGYRVTLAKDGMDALERLAEERPQVVLSDIEMPRMDGFDLVRNIRGDRRLADLPVIMITSRIAQKHRDYAAELGVDHYLGKPYSEEDLLALIGRYTAAKATA